MDSKEQIEHDRKIVESNNKKEKLLTLVGLAASILLVISAIIVLIANNHTLYVVNVGLAFIIALSILLQRYYKKGSEKIIKPYIEKYKDQLPMELR